jgi:hypothetical protein
MLVNPGKTAGLAVNRAVRHLGELPAQRGGVLRVHHGAGAEPQDQVLLNKKI